MPTSQILPIELYFWPTPNGFKISIMLEELARSLRGEIRQYRPRRAVFPRFPGDLAQQPHAGDRRSRRGRTGSRSPSSSRRRSFSISDASSAASTRPDERRRVAVEEWLAWQVANVGPVFGNNNHFRNYAGEKLPYAITRFLDETYRLYRVLNQRLEGRSFVCDEYSIADIALLGWTRNWQRRGIDIDEFPNVRDWIKRLEARPAVQRGLAIKAPVEVDISKDEAARKILFNQR